MASTIRLPFSNARETHFFGFVVPSKPAKLRPSFHRRHFVRVRFNGLSDNRIFGKVFQNLFCRGEGSKVPFFRLQVHWGSQGGCRQVHSFANSWCIVADCLLNLLLGTVFLLNKIVLPRKNFSRENEVAVVKAEDLWGHEETWLAVVPFSPASFGHHEKQLWLSTFGELP